MTSFIFLLCALCVLCGLNEFLRCFSNTCTVSIGRDIACEGAKKNAKTPGFLDRTNAREVSVASRRSDAGPHQVVKIPLDVANQLSAGTPSIEKLGLINSFRILRVFA
jgi:hypothetical protein